MVSLGCPKNRVDSEVMVGLIQQDEEFVMVADVEDADIVVVNTCGFIDAAKEESVDTIMEMVHRKNAGRLQKVVVSGCLSQRYSGELEKEIPELDAILGTQTFTSINKALRGQLENKTYIQPGSFIMDAEVARTNTIRGGTAYLKIAEGCSRSCSFCIIPKIRGDQRSRTIDDVVAEARKLGRSGVREIILVAQDMTSYGIDLDPKHNRDYLERLLRRLDDEAVEVDWVRLLYMYPWNFTDELLEIFSSSERILPMYKPYEERIHYVAISEADRHPDLRYAATIHHGINPKDFPLDPVGGEDLLYFGRIHPDKGAGEAIRAATAL